MNIVLLGIQGSGKGTQARIIVDRYKLNYFEMGGELRKLATENSPLGLKVKEIIESGNLVPAHIIMQILDNFLSKLQPSDGLVLDGIPRNSDQQKEFDALMAKYNRDFKVMHFMVPENETIKRLLARHRQDDIPEVITQRIKVFIRDTKPVIAEYKKRGNVIEINGNQPIETVANEVSEKLALYTTSLM